MFALYDYKDTLNFLYIIIKIYNKKDRSCKMLNYIDRSYTVSTHTYSNDYHRCYETLQKKSCKCVPSLIIQIS